MLFVVGLGNPGGQYERTRHNVGFDVIAELADRHRFPVSKSFKNAQVSKGRIAGEDVLLVQPMTYMNLSGDAVGPIVRYYRGDCSDVVVVHDELDFEPGVVRIKKGGGHGGHNGLKSIAGHLGKEFTRIRLGVGKPPRGDGAGHVLGRFSADDRLAVDESISDACTAVELLIRDGVAKAMGKFNQKEKKQSLAKEENSRDLN